jgi:hypothetical protein
MNTHDLARLLLTLPDLPVATHAHNHTYMTGASHSGALKIGLLQTYGGDHIVIGNISKRNINGPNYYVTKMLHGDAPEEWRPL